MRVLQIAANDIRGGASLAGYRLHQALRAMGCQSEMLVGRKYSDDSSVRSVEKSMKLNRRIGRFYRRTLIRGRTRYYKNRKANHCERFDDDRSELGLDLLHQLGEYDVYFLNWVNGLIDYTSFFRFCAENRLNLVWRMPDMTAFTGGCCYAWECTGYRTGCGQCPQLCSTKKKDLSYQIYSRKKMALDFLSSKQMHIVALNRWMVSHKELSPMLSRFQHVIIPNGVDPDFSPVDKIEAKRVLGIKPEAKVVAFAANTLTNVRKNLKGLLATLKKLADMPDLLVLAIGNSESLGPIDIPYKTLGYLSDVKELSTAYSAADLFVTSALEDNQPNTVLEAMACGTPVVGFNVGGISEMVEENVTGVLVPRADNEGLASCISELLGNERLRKDMSKRCLVRVRERYSRVTQASSYYTLFERILNGV